MALEDGRAATMFHSEPDLRGAHRPHHSYVWQAPQHPLRPTIAEMVLLAALSAFYPAADFNWPNCEDVINIIGGLSLMVVLLGGAVQMLKIESASIWAALFWFRVSTAIYFGFGSVVPFILNDFSSAYLLSFYPFSAAEHLKLNTVIALCMSCVVFAAYMTTIVGPKVPPRRIFADTDGRSDAGRLSAQAYEQRLNVTKQLGLFFLVIGAALKFLVIFPHAMGWVGGDMDGIISMLSGLSMAGIYLITLWSLMIRSRAGLAAITFYTGIEMGAGLLLLAKTEVLLPLMVYLIALLSHRITRARSIIAASAMLAFFQLLGPLVSTSRDKYHDAMAGGTEGMGLIERMTLIGSYFDGIPFIMQSGLGTADEKTQIAEEFQSSLLRVCYTNAATLAVNLYDRGRPGNSFDNILATFIPRFLWPDKPVFNTGQQFATTATGRIANNSVSPGLFAEAYWNFGWLGIPLLMLPLGVILTLFSNYAVSVSRRGDWMYMPILFIGMKTGVACDGLFVGTILGSMVFVVALHWVIFYLVKILAPLGFKAMLPQN
jgi:hypothetical protein